MQKIKWLVAAFAFFGISGIVLAQATGPEVYGFKVDKISKDDDVYRQGNLYLLTGPDGKEQYIIVRDISGAVAIIKRDPVKK